MLSVQKLFVSLLLFLCPLFSQVGPQELPPAFQNQIVKFGLDPQEKFIAFFGDMQKYVKSDNRKCISKMVQYPIVVTNGSRKIKISNAGVFIRKYDLVFNSKVKNAIIAQKIGEISISSKGAMIGSGEIWFANVKEKASDEFILRIIAINN